MPTTRKVVPADVLEQRFALALYQLHQYVNLLDLNLGLSIRSMENPGNVEESHNWLSKSNLALKLEKFRSLVEGKEGNARELDSWYSMAHQARCDRNIFAHAYWDMRPLDVDTPVHMRLHPWVKEGMNTGIPEAMSLEEFEDIANNVQNTFEEFSRLRRVLNV